MYECLGYRYKQTNKHVMTSCRIICANQQRLNSLAVTVLMMANFQDIRLGSEMLDVLKEKQPGLPRMCMEFWSGWFDHWGDKSHQSWPIKGASSSPFLLRFFSLLLSFYSFSSTLSSLLFFLYDFSSTLSLSFTHQFLRIHSPSLRIYISCLQSWFLRNFRQKIVIEFQSYM